MWGFYVFADGVVWMGEEGMQSTETVALRMEGNSDGDSDRWQMGTDNLALLSCDARLSSLAVLARAA